MKDKQDFYAILGEIDGLEASEYGRIQGDFDFGRYVLKAVRSSADGDLGRTLFLVRVPAKVAGFPAHLFTAPVRRVGLEDLLTRKMADRVDRFARFNEQGVARRCIAVAAPGQKILPRSCVSVGDDGLEARLYVSLPVAEGKILGEAAREIFFHDLPQLANDALVYANLDAQEVEEFVNGMEDADQVRQMLPTRGLISFLADGSLLARRQGSDGPDLAHATPLTVADDLRADMEVPNLGTVKGLGIPAGITVILGDDYSGRAELVRAIAAGIYNHVPGDGREMAITLPDVVYVAAEPGRSVQRVDISPLVPAAPGLDSAAYTATCAEGPAAQAAAMMEALEVGARALLFDESDSAPGFLAQDPRVSGLLGQPHAVSLATRARQLADEMGVSFVIGGTSAAAAFVAIADTVLKVDNFRVTNVTREAKAAGFAPPATVEPVALAATVEKSRWVVPSSIDASSGRLDADVSASSMTSLRFGRQTVDLSALRQLADVHQTATIGLIISYARQRYLDEARPLRELMDLVDRDLSTEGLECLTRELRGDLARPRRYEVAAALNRLRSMRISHTTG